ncbi:hypothetical protein IM538_04135 [Cytobacillus suaedae]|nr:hypothetical protein IM538_04135 [Cytobacillus suaedae]
MKRTILLGVLFSIITNLLLLFALYIYLNSDAILNVFNGDQVYYLQNDRVLGYVGPGTASSFLGLLILKSFVIFFILFVVIRLIVKFIKNITISDR